MLAVQLVAQIFLVVLCFCFGASIGSFLGVVIERVPRHETIMGSSHCACGRPLKWYENVPVIGWLRIGGLTKCCNTRLPAWYLILEIVVGVVFAAAGFYLLFFTSVLA